MCLAGGAELMGYVFLLTFGLCSLGIGAITAKYGTGVSRNIGIITAVIGLVFLLIFSLVASGPGEVFAFTIVSGLGTIIGVLIGLGIFLFAIMKS